MYNHKTQNPTTTITFSNGKTVKADIQICGPYNTIILPGSNLVEVAALSNGWELIEAIPNTRTNKTVLYLRKKS